MTAEQKRNEAVRLMKSRRGKNRYTQGEKREYFFGWPAEGWEGYSDCSSAVAACLRRAAGLSIGANSSAQLDNRARALVVDAGGGLYPDESKLLPGDLIYFKGNKNHTLGVGHVEMYTGPDECYGHGSGKGPTKKNLRSYARKRGKDRGYLMTLRWILEDDPAALGELVVTGGHVNLREGPGTQFPVVAVVKRGARLPREESAANGWYAVRYAQKLCFITGVYAKPAGTV